MSARARHFHADPTVGRRFEQAAKRLVKLKQSDSLRSPGPALRKPAGRFAEIREQVERNLLHISAVLFFVGSVGWCWLIFTEFRSPGSVSPTTSAYAATGIGKTDYGIGDLDPFSTSTYEPGVQRLVQRAAVDRSGESPASIVAREWSQLQTRVTERVRAPAPAKQAAAKDIKPNLKQPVRLASLEGSTPAVAVPPSRIPANVGAVTSLVDFETAPFPYHGTVPGSDRPFLNAGETGHRGHVNFRGRVLWEAETFSDDRVLLHIPPGFDPRRPAVMVVFFHGHGANLARDVRDRQQVPAQITAAGANAVLVAPQFAVDAADSSAGKFWEPNGFKRFLDEAAVKLARMYGDPGSATAFAKMPIVIVAYSGGFGPTLSVLDHGGVQQRIRGLVLLDALYAGFDKFADWIAENRSTFFVSAYTPHTAHHNAYLEHLLAERSIPYGSELRRSHLPGMVTFLPAGDISHRDFVNHAWADYPIKDVLVRMDDVDPSIITATGSVSRSASSRN